MQQSCRFSIGERRVVHLFKEVGPNLKTLGGEMKDTIKEAAESKDPIKYFMAPVIVAASALFQGSDYLFAGAVDKKIKPAEGSETLHDLKGLAEHIGRIEPIKAVVTALKMPGNMAMDLLRVMGGFRGKAHHALAA